MIVIRYSGRQMIKLAQINVYLKRLLAYRDMNRYCFTVSRR